MKKKIEKKIEKKNCRENHYELTQTHNKNAGDVELIRKRVDVK